MSEVTETAVRRAARILTISDFSTAWAIAAKRSGIVRTVKSAGLQSATSSQASGAETRASGSGRTEYAEHVVRSLAFWL